MRRRKRVKVDERKIGKGVRVKVGTVVSGEGAALTNIVIEQDASYWEVKLLSAGTVGVGLASAEATEFDALRFEEREKDEAKEQVGVSFRVAAKEADTKASESETTAKMKKQQHPVKVGDVVGVAFCQSDMPKLMFYLNGAPMPSCDVERLPFRRPCPGISVSDGASAQFVFSEDAFKYSPPKSKCSELIKATSVL